MHALLLDMDPMFYKIQALINFEVKIVDLEILGLLKFPDDICFITLGIDLVNT